MGGSTEKGLQRRRLWVGKERSMAGGSNGGRASELEQKTSQRKTEGSTRLVTAPPLILKTHLVDE